MALELADRVRETTAVTGTSSAVLLGAVTGFQSFAVIGDGNTCYYTISDQSGPNFEVGIGTYSTSGPTLARTTVLSSSNGGALVPFPAGTKDVFVTYPAEKSVNLDASGNVSPLGTVASGTWQATAITTTYGGTGLTSYTAGDLPYYATGTTFTKLGIGTAGQVLTSTGSAPQWSTLSGVAVTTFSAGTTGFTPNSATSGAVTLGGTLATTNGGTGLTSFTSGGAVYATSTSALTTGTLPVASGGTGLTTLTTGRIPFGAGTSAFGNSANLFFDSVNTRFGVGTASPAVTASLVGIDAMLIPKGATGDRPTGVSGYLRFNTTTSEFEGYNGTAWASVGGAALSNDTSTATALFPLFASATTGTAATLLHLMQNYCTRLLTVSYKQQSCMQTTVF